MLFKNESFKSVHIVRARNNNITVGTVLMSISVSAAPVFYEMTDIEPSLRQLRVIL